MSEPVITGLGLVCALGVGREVGWHRLLAGESGLRPLTRLDPTGLRNTLAGEVPTADWLAAAPHLAFGPRVWGYAAWAVDEALSHAGLRDEVDLGAVLATNFGGQHGWLTAAEPSAGVDLLEFGAAARRPPTASFAGPVVTLSNACSSGTQALGHAADLVRLGLADRVVACGFDELGMYCLSGLSILHTISTDTLRPFDVHRSGTIFGEGAGALVVESRAAAAARGVQPLATVLGYGVNNNAFHMTAPDKGGEGMVEAIRLALRQAGLASSAITHVNAHATGTEYHDPAETAALQAVLGDRAKAVPVSAIKAATGHAMGAAGAIEAVASVLALRDGVLPPTLNLTQHDPACDLDVVTTARPWTPGVVLSVSAGLGGNNAAVLLGSGR